jgi:hypothetical protein
MANPTKKPLSLQMRLFGLVEAIAARLVSVETQRLSKIEDRLAALDGGEDGAAVADRAKAALRAKRT